MITKKNTSIKTRPTLQNPTNVYEFTSNSRWPGTNVSRINSSYMLAYCRYNSKWRSHWNITVKVQGDNCQETLSLSSIYASKLIIKCTPIWWYFANNLIWLQNLYIIFRVSNTFVVIYWILILSATFSRISASLSKVQKENNHETIEWLSCLLLKPRKYVFCIL